MTAREKEKFSTIMTISTKHVQMLEFNLTCVLNSKYVQDSR